jgi:hypothetical protein
MPNWVKRTAVIMVLCTLMVLAALGVVDRLLGWCGLNRLQQANTQYLDSTFDDALAGFLILSGIKSGLAVVEGSTVGVGVNVQLGDVVQPVYDYVDTAWKAAMAGASIIAVMKLALQGLALVDHWALAFLLLLWVLWSLADWIVARWTGFHGSLKEAIRFCTGLCVILYLLLPLTILAAGLISRHITAPVLQSSQEELKAIGESLSPEGLYQRFLPQGQNEEDLSSFDLKGKIKKMGQGIKALMAYLKLETEHIAALTLKLIAAYLFDCIIFPLLFGLILMTMIKSAVRYLFELDRPGADPAVAAHR